MGDWKEKILFVCKVLAITVIPSMYTIVYLSANIDPYGNLDQIPVAIVNDDEGVDLSNGEHLTIGDDVTEGIIDSKGFAFKQFDDVEDVPDNYYMALEIDKNFTNYLINFKENNYKKAPINLLIDESKNYIFVSISEGAQYEIEKDINEQILQGFLGIGADAANVSIDEVNQTSKDLEQATKDINGDIDEMQVYIDGKITDLKALRTELKTKRAEVEEIDAKLTTQANDLKTNIDETNNDINGRIKDYQTSINDSYTELDKLVTANAKALDTSAKEAAKASDSQKVSATQAKASAEAKANTEKIKAEQEAILESVKTVNSDVNKRLADAQGQIDSKASTMQGQIDTTKAKTEKSYDELMTELDKIIDTLEKMNKETEETQNEVMSNEHLGEQFDVIKNINKKVQFYAAPVELNRKSVNPVPNYGYGLAPYFISLSLFVGAIILSTVFPPREAKELFRRLGKYGTYIFYISFAFTQVFVMTTLMIVLLDFTFLDFGQYLLYTLTISMFFITIVTFLSYALEEVGQFLAFLLLVLQLGASAGTFPAETLPPLFKVINPLIPMTYTVEKLRQILFVKGSSIGTEEFGMLVFIVIVGILIIMLIKYRLETLPKREAASKSNKGE